LVDSLGTDSYKLSRITLIDVVFCGSNMPGLVREWANGNRKSIIDTVHRELGPLSRLRGVELKYDGGSPAWAELLHHKKQMNALVAASGFKRRGVERVLASMERYRVK